MFERIPESGTVDAGDEALRTEARARLAKRADLQLVAEIYEKLRASDFDWWSPAFTMRNWPASARMEWLRDRPDLRQEITTALTGLPKKTAREKDVEFQANLIESVLTHGDVSPDAVERAFSSIDMALYGPAREIWNELRSRFPWSDDAPAHQRFMSWLIRELLVDRSSLDPEMSRKPILTPCDVRSAIDASVWHTRMPLDIRIAIDTARLKLERGRPREPFHTGSELAIATPEIIAASIPLAELAPVLAAADIAIQMSDRISQPTISMSIPAANSVSAPPISSVRGMPSPLISLRRVG